MALRMRTGNSALTSSRALALGLGHEICSAKVNTQDQEEDAWHENC